MPIVTPSPRPVAPRRRIVAAAVSAALAASLLVPVGAPAQGDALSVPAITKEQAKEARQSASGSSSDGFGISLEMALLIGGIIAIGGAGFYILRDSSQAIGAGSRPAPGRPGGRPTSDSVGRGAPKTMFDTEAAAGAGKHGKRKKRVKAKRQKQARRHNR